MLPAPDAMRCDHRHPANSLTRCFKVAHGDGLHQHEKPLDSEVYHATIVRQWRTGPPRPSEFPDGPYLSIPPNDPPIGHPLT